MRKQHCPRPTKGLFSWLAIAIATLSSFFVLSTVLAETNTISQPVAEDQTVINFNKKACVGPKCKRNEGLKKYYKRQAEKKVIKNQVKKNIQKKVQKGKTNLKKPQAQPIQ